jgi:hypothetical protein
MTTSHHGLGVAGPQLAQLPSASPTPPPDEDDLSTRRKHRLDDDEENNLDFKAQKENVEEGPRYPPPPPLPSRDYTPPASISAPSPSTSVYLQNTFAPAGMTGTASNSNFASRTDIAAFADSSDSAEGIKDEPILPTTSNAEGKDESIGLSHWNHRRLEWTSGHKSPASSASGGSKHPGLEEVNPSHFDAIYGSLVTAQRKFTK